MATQVDRGGRDRPRRSGGSSSRHSGRTCRPAWRTRWTSTTSCSTIKPNEDVLAQELIACFERSLPLADITALPYGFDLLNEVFGSFIADSFADEKELGQYLTPPEVVELMVDLAIQSLAPAELDALLSPGDSRRFGLILDPSCGVGSFLVQLTRRLHPAVVERHGVDAGSAWLRTMLDEVLVGIDKSERMVRLALTNFAMFGWPAAGCTWRARSTVSATTRRSPMGCGGKRGSS